MNKNFITIVILVAIVILGGVGYAIWSNSNPTVKTPVTTSTDTTGTTTAPVSQAGLPIVETNSTSAPYISTVVLSGIVNPNGGLTTYWFDYGQTASLGAKTVIYVVGSGYADFYTPAYITGLASNTNYYFRLTANNAFGTVSGATYSFKTNTNPPPSGTTPATTTSAATDIARNTVSLNGQINPNGSQTTYWFEYGVTSGLGLTTSLRSSTDNGKSLLSVSVPVSNLSPLTKYYFRLNAQNQFGTVNGQILNFTTQGPSTATAPTVKTNSASLITNNSARLNALVNSDGAITTYWFEYGNNSSLANALITSKQTLDINTASINGFASVSNLNSNTKYYFRSVAQNQYGITRGDTSSFTTKR